eukprot:TRINITY_DN2850_c4_g1_i1.p1 TRINITY_DN2850_c4_g1~~TRINITY_DN2850_c4_g1_i1.p1  ORF type:complete len:4740 (+),score=1148.16 TRINITY_DN2850_c4_g1_i1:842-14221(+)
MSFPTITETGSQTGTLTSSETLSSTFSLSATQSDTASTTFTETASASMTYSFSDTSTQTESATLTATQSGTRTLSLSKTLPAHDNYTLSMDPVRFVEGQEVRLRFAATLRGSVHVKHFNATGGPLGELEVLVYRFQPQHRHHCLQYMSFEVPAARSTEFGRSVAEHVLEEFWVAAAHITFTAPHHEVPFIVCFRHLARYPSVDFPHSGQALLFTAAGYVLPGATEPVAGYVWRSAPAGSWVRATDPTVAQYAVLLVESAEPWWNFTRPSAACALGDEQSCAWGDSLKLVPAGVPCTAERTATRHRPTTEYPLGEPVTPFLGSAFVGTEGQWLPTAYEGMSEGATRGGVGVFGAARRHPLLDGVDAGVPYIDDDLIRRGFFYVRLPDTPGHYDVCFSALEQRRLWRTENATADQVPVWRKLWRCQHGCPDGAPRGDTFSRALARGTPPSIYVAPESLGWSMLDVSENTWGPMRVADSAGATLSRAPVQIDERSARRDYWAPAGGDQVKLVGAEHFAEEPLQFRSWPLEKRPLGSTPSVGCWHRTVDLWEEAAPYPTASFDLGDDPTLPVQQRADNARGVTDAYFEPFTGPVHRQRYVCYRRNGTGEGWRALPWQAQLPQRWRHLRPPEGPLPQPLTSGAPYQPPEDPLGATAPSLLRWYMNDTRAGTWGPVWIEPSNLSGTTVIDARRHNLPLPPPAATQSRSATAEQLLVDQPPPPVALRSVVGTALRLVPVERPCTYPQFHLWAEGAESTDGGEAECPPGSVAEGCLGAAADQIGASAAFFVLVPRTPGEFRVCVQPGGWNWREARPAEAGWRGFDEWMPTESMFRLVAAPPPTLDIQMLEHRAGMDAVILVTDPQGQLSASGRGGDELALVPDGAPCDNRAGRPPVVIDAHLSMLCPVIGAGTPEKSGLSRLPCASDAAAKAILGCPDTALGCNSSAPLLGAYSAATPQIFDDIPPYEPRSWFVGGTAAYVTLPSPAGGRDLWRVCYKQGAVGPNWVIANNTFQIVERPLLSLSPNPRSPLVAGQLMEFVLEWPPGTDAPAPPPLGLRAFAAKLVRRRSGSPNDGCLTPAASTDAQPFAAATRTISPDSASTSRVRFVLVVPHSAGEHWLCVHAPLSATEGGFAWQRFGPYNVADAAVRWWVPSGQAPTNRGTVLMHFARCSPDASGSCRMDGGAAAGAPPLDTRPGRDAAKLVPATQFCHDGSADMGHLVGPSVHVAVEGDRVDGVTDLGPADGPSETATAAVTAPAIPADAPRAYKVCLLASFADGDRRTWVEVRQATGLQQQEALPDGFTTAPGQLRDFTLSAALRPVTLSGALPLANESGVVAVGGATTRYVDRVGSFADGLRITAHGPLPPVAISVKLVAAAAPRTRVPPSGGAWLWEPVSSLSCLGEPVEATHAGPDAYDCSAELSQYPAACPAVAWESDSALVARVQLPPEVGRYLVCARIGDGAWLWLPSSDGEGDSLYAAESLLEVVIPTLPPGAGAATNATVSDLARDGSASVGAWCPAAESCALVGGDWLAVTNASQLCPVDPTPTLRGWWFPLVRTAEATAMLASSSDAVGNGLFRMPPVWGGGTGRFKLCVLKGGQNAGGLGVARAGVSYQLWNGAAADTGTGGQSGFHQVGATPDRLLAEAAVDLNGTGRFAVFDTATAIAFDLDAPAPTEQSGFRSQSFVVRSGEAVEVTVRLARGSSPVPIGSGKVWVEFCPAAQDSLGVRCLGPSSPQQVASGWPPFVAWNGFGECRREDGPAFGLPHDGLTQRLRQGVASFQIQLRSTCPRPIDPGSKIRVGCGMVFKAEATAGATISSPPLWLNIEDNAPDAISAGDVQAASGVAPEQCSFPPQCVSVICQHGSLCEIDFQAWRTGIREFAPVGGAWVRPATAIPAGFTQSSFPGLTSNWARGGHLLYSARPFLQPGVTQAWLDLNISFGSCPWPTCAPPPGSSVPRVVNWARVRVVVRRRQPNALLITGLAALDAGEPALRQSRVPAPAWAPESGFGGNALTASVGSFVEAVVPYQITFAAVDDMGPLSDLDGWTVELQLQAGQYNQLLRVDVGADGRPSGGNLLTSPQQVQPWATPTPTRGPDEAGSPRWKIDFRVLNNHGCSRWDGEGLGCRFEIRIRRPGVPTELDNAPPDQVISATLDSPVRVPATTLQVIVPSPVAPLTDGVTAVVLPGTPSLSEAGFLHDEFHGGDVYAMLSSPEPITNGATRDGTRLTEASAERYRCQRLPPDPRDPRRRPRWGAELQLKTTRPCIRCEVTFHTTWGAGPEPAVVPGLQAGGVLSVSLVDDARGISCEVAGNADVRYEAVPGTQSHPFDVTVRPVSSFGGHTDWARWWSYVPTGAIISLPDGTPVTNVAVRRTGAAVVARMGANATATFRDLILDGELSAYLELQIQFAAIATSYNDTLDGTVASGEARWPCQARVRLSETSEAPADPPRRLRVLGAAGATALCGPDGPMREDEYAGCTAFSLSASAAASVDFTLAMLHRPRGEWIAEEDAAANLTIGVGAVVAAAKPALAGNMTCARETDRTVCRTPSVALASMHQPLHLSDQDGTLTDLSFGSTNAAVRFTLDEGASTAIARGRGTVTVDFGETPAPVREALWAICVTLRGTAVTAPATSIVLDGTDACVQLRIWLVPPQLPNRRVHVFDPGGGTPYPDGGRLVPGVAERCGAAAGLVSVGAALVFDWGGVVHAEYGVDVAFLLSAASEQIFVAANDTSRVGRQLRESPVQSRASSEAARLAAPPSMATFRVFGLDPVAEQSASVLTITAEIQDSTAAPGATKRRVWWAADSGDTSADFQVMQVPGADDDCTTRRHMPSVDKGYLTAAPDPGSGWSLAAEGAVVGTPFPIQAKVTTRSGARAYTHPPSLVVVTKQAAGGCNDGGSMSVLTLTPAQTGADIPLLDGESPLSFRELPSGAARTLHGQVTLWVNFTEPCQSCTLTLQLCYVSSSGGSDCLVDVGGGGPPILSVRSQLSAPFTVLPKRPRVPVITEQSTPSTEEPVLVGAMFSVRMRLVEVFGGRWVVGAGAQESSSEVLGAWVSTDWLDPDPLGPAARRYGNGGFLAAGAAVCGYEPAVGQPPVWLGGSANGTVLRFHLTRPCSMCGITVLVRLRGESGAEGPSTRLHLRATATHPSGAWTVPLPGRLSLRARTCPRAWLLAVAPAAVRRRRPFSVCILRVDAGNIPSWTAEGVVAVTPLAGAGNGGGGSLSITSPTVAGPEPPPGQDPTPGAVGVVDDGGSVVVRMQYNRACWRCTVSLGALKHTVTVLTDATHFRVVESPKTDPPMLLEPNQVAMLRYVGYLADDAGDRAYGEGGPTALQWLPRWAQQPVPAAQLVVRPPAVESTERLLSRVDGSASVVVVADSGGTPTVANGSQVINGIPYGVTGSFPELPHSAGVLIITAAAAPLSAFVPELTVDGAVMRMRMVSGGIPRPIDWRVAAEHIVVGNGSAIRVTVGEPTQLDVRAVARRPGAAEAENTHYVATGQNGRVGVSYDCSRCVGCEPQAPTNVPMHRGRATVPILIPNGEGSCQLTVSPPAELSGTAAPQRVELRVTNPAVVQWLWDSTPDLTVSGSSTASAVRSTAAAGGLHTLRIRSWAETAPLPPLSEIFAWDAEQLGTISLVTPDAAGCFTPENLAPEPIGAFLQWKGRFSPDFTRCRVAVSGTPAGASARQALDVDVAVPLRIEVLPQLGRFGESFNFSSLDAVTSEGEPAATAGGEVVVRARVVDSRGLLVEGDYGTTVSLTGWREGAPGDLSAAATVQAGVARVVLRPERSTRGADCSAVCAVGRTCCRTIDAVHRPWWFKVAASHPDGKEFDDVAAGPLHVVAAASVLQVEYSTLHSAVPKWKLMPDMRWGEQDPSDLRVVVGYPLSLRVFAIDASDPPNVAAAPDDVGSDTTIVFQPSAVPCVDADRAFNSSGSLWITRTCATAAGACSTDGLPSCGVGGWRLGPPVVEQTDPDIDAARLSVTLDSGVGVINQAVYSGADGVAGFSLTGPVFTATPFITELTYTAVSSVGLFPQAAPANITCRPATAAELLPTSPEHADWRCTLPRGECSATGECTRVFYNVSAERIPRLTPNYQVTASLARILPGVPFSLSVRLLNSGGETVAGVTDTKFRIRAECAAPGWDGSAASRGGFSFGVLGGVTGAQVVRAADDAEAVEGEAHWQRLGFAGYCANASLVLECITNPDIDTARGCHGRIVRSELFELGDSTREDDSPAPPDTPNTPEPTVRDNTTEWPTVVMRFGPVDFSSFFDGPSLNISSLHGWRQEFELRMGADARRRIPPDGPTRVDSVNLTLLCNVPYGAGGPSEQPDLALLRYDPAVCLDFGSPPLSLRRRAALLESACIAAGCTPVVEFLFVGPNATNPDIAVVYFDAVKALAQDELGEVYSTYSLPPTAHQSIVAVYPPAPSTDSPAPPSTPLPTDAPAPREVHAPVASGGRLSPHILAAVLALAVLRAV